MQKAIIASVVAVLIGGGVYIAAKSGKTSNPNPTSAVANRGGPTLVEPPKDETPTIVDPDGPTIVDPDGSGPTIVDPDSQSGNQNVTDSQQTTDGQTDTGDKGNEAGTTKQGDDNQVATKGNDDKGNETGTTKQGDDNQVANKGNDDKGNETGTTKQGNDNQVANKGNDDKGNEAGTTKQGDDNQVANKGNDDKGNETGTTKQGDDNQVATKGNDDKGNDTGTTKQGDDNQVANKGNDDKGNETGTTKQGDDNQVAVVDKTKKTTPPTETGTVTTPVDDPNSNLLDFDRQNPGKKLDPIWKKPIPVKVELDYTVVSDYIFRGINYNQRDRNASYPLVNRRNTPNHQLSAIAEIDLGKMGRAGYQAWFNWYSGQSTINPLGEPDFLQEVDHRIYYGYTFHEIGLDVEAGYIWFNYPLRRKESSTQEIYLQLSYDDSHMWRALGFTNTREPVLNPYLKVFWDVTTYRGAMYFEAGISHDFYFADYGLATTPIFKDLTIKPSLKIGWDKDWMNQNSNLTRGPDQWSLDFLNWGLEMNLDLKSALGLQDQYCGSLYLKGFINYSQALRRSYLEDEFYGGMSVGYSW